MSYFGTKTDGKDRILAGWANEVETKISLLSAPAPNYETTATALSAYTPTTVAANGVQVTVYSSHATDGGIAIFTYGNAAWSFHKVPVSYESTATALSAYTPATATYNGGQVLVYSSHATDGGTAIFARANGVWGYRIIPNFGGSDVSFCEEW